MYVSATVVKDYANYWVDFRSHNIEVTVQSGQSEPEPEPEPSAHGHEPEPEPEPEAEHKSGHPVYSDCGSSKTCFGVPGGCEDRGDCDVLAAWVQGGNFTQVELFSKTGRARFAALGLSLDNKMGQDYIMSCAEDGAQLEHWQVQHDDAEG